jgi:hypothetical protein
MRLLPGTGTITCLLAQRRQLSRQALTLRLVLHDKPAVSGGFFSALALAGVFDVLLKFTVSGNRTG